MRSLLDHRVLLHSAPEFVAREDGESNNDCERNAMKRYL